MMCFLGNKFSKNLGYFEILAHFFFRFFLNLIFSEILAPNILAPHLNYLAPFSKSKFGFIFCFEI